MTRRPRAARSLLVAVLATAATGTACGSQAQEPTPSLKDQIAVSGGFGARPSIEVKAPLSLKQTASWVTRTGDGDDTVGADSTAILQLTIADGRTGKTAISTRDAGQRALEVKMGDQVFPSLAQALTGKPTGSRVVVASTEKDAYGSQGSPQIGIKAGDPVVIVADVISTDPADLVEAPTGASHPLPRNLPRVVEAKGVPASLDFATLRKPGRYRAFVLREGTGQAVTDPARVAVSYVGQVWGAAKPFEENFTTKPALVSVGLGSVIKAWDRALVGLKEGSRVMIVCPPATAYGATAQGAIPARSTLVFVVDVLGVG
ncbi:MAG: peptidylprolyl isomerase, FKBP-type [Marmoricola sp.]|nr:peptidylprolyl isomerase, FKBP-type [Marmoricola sp.]